MTLVDFNQWFNERAALLVVGETGAAELGVEMSDLWLGSTVEVREALGGSARKLVERCRPDLADGQLVAVRFDMSHRCIEILWSHRSLPVWSMGSMGERIPLVPPADEPATSSSPS